MKARRKGPISLGKAGVRYNPPLSFATGDAPGEQSAGREVGMPIYEYRCASCGFQSEYLQKVSDPVLSDCPKCGQATFRKLLTAAGFQLKGSGWYATDFKNSGAKPAEKKTGGDAKADAGSASEAGSKTDSTPDSKSSAEGSGTACGAGACSACS